MERELWPPLYHRLRRAGADLCQAHVQHQPRAIACVLVWAALHDRPVGWACDARNWSTTTLRPWQVPSASTVSRRRHRAVGLLLRAAAGLLRQAGRQAPVSYLDGKPLPVGPRSKGPDGRPRGPLGPGYKLHAIWTTQPVPAAWVVTAVGAGEAPVAEGLVGTAGGAGYLLAAGNYDPGALFDRAAEAGYRMVVPAWRVNAGKGHRRQSEPRLRSIAPVGTNFGRRLYALRAQVERCFGNAGSFAGGLQPLPAWVRGAHRVWCWVAAKLLINGVRIARKQRLVA
jgi:hypothetical protein